MKSIRLSLVLAFSSLALAACGTVDLSSYDPRPRNPGEGCAEGSIATSTCAPSAPCAPGYVPGVICGSNRIYSGCTCVPDPNRWTVDAGIRDSGVTFESCTGEGATRPSACRTCSPGYVSIQICRSGSWSACDCAADVGGGRTCVNNGVPTTNSCRVCTTGYVAQQSCNANGFYEGCVCAQAQNGTTTCQANVSRGTACTFSCSNGGTAPGTEFCNSSGNGYVCQQNAGTTCSGSGTTCTANQSRGTACTFSCSNGGTALGTEFCNSSGNGYVCQQNAGTTCSGGGSTGGGGGCGGGTLVVRARNANQLVRCWGNGQVWTSTSRELRAQLDGNQCGYSECVTGTLASNGSFIEDEYFATGRNGSQGSIQDMFDFAGVEGRHADLVNQTSVARMWTDTRGRTKGVIAVNIQCRGLGSNC